MNVKLQMEKTIEVDKTPKVSILGITLKYENKVINKQRYTYQEV